MDKTGQSCLYIVGYADSFYDKISEISRLIGDTLFDTDNFKQRTSCKTNRVDLSMTW